MKKIKLYAIGNKKDFNYYIFDKTNEVIKILSKLFSEVFKVYFKLFEEYEDKRGKWKSKDINFEKIKDSHRNVSDYDDKGRIDIFYGDKKIFVTIHCSQKRRLKFNEELAKISSIVKSKKKLK